MHWVMRISKLSVTKCFLELKWTTRGVKTYKDLGEHQSPNGYSLT